MAPGAGRPRLQILAAWFSPGYPVGAYSYSHGLEWAVEAGWVTGRDTLAAWIADLLAHGAGRSDAILLAAAWRADDPAPIAELAEALAPSAERHLETMAQGAAFARTTTRRLRHRRPAGRLPGGGRPRRAPARAAARSRPPRSALQAFAANIVSAGVRLIPLGQTDGQRITAGLLPLAAEVAAAPPRPPIRWTQIGGLALAADLAAMLHETQYTRLYRS